MSRRERKEVITHQEFVTPMPESFPAFLASAGHRMINVQFVGSEIVFSWKEG